MQLLRVTCGKLDTNYVSMGLFLKVKMSSFYWIRLKTSIHLLLLLAERLFTPAKMQTASALLTSWKTRTSRTQCVEFMIHTTRSCVCLKVRKCIFSYKSNDCNDQVPWQTHPYVQTSFKCIPQVLNPQWIFYNRGQIIKKKIIITSKIFLSNKKHETATFCFSSMWLKGEKKAVWIRSMKLMRAPNDPCAHIFHKF